MNACVFCESTLNLQAAHLIAHKDIDSGSLESTFDRCTIASVQDVSNGITACQECHYCFDNYLVGVNPETMLVEVSKALLHSVDPKVCKKWGIINGKKIEKRSNKGHFPSTEAFNEKYIIFCDGRDKRREKQKELCFQCDICKKYLKTERGVKQHKSKNGCTAYLSRSRKFKNLVSPVKGGSADL
jgi:hypothetical protein